MLTPKKSVHQMKITNLKTWIIPKNKVMLLADESQSFNFQNENKMFKLIELQKNEIKDTNNINNIQNRFMRFKKLWKDYWISVLKFKHVFKIKFFCKFSEKIYILC